MDNQYISIYNIFIFFLIISSNYLGELFPCKVQKMLDSNMLFKHIFGFLTLSFFVILTDKSIAHNFKHIFFNSFMLYGIFLIFINNTVNFFIISLFIAAIIYIINIKINTIEQDTPYIIQNNQPADLLIQLNIINQILSCYAMGTFNERKLNNFIIFLKALHLWGFFIYRQTILSLHI